MSTIPASAIVTVNPSVLSAGGSGLNLSGLILTDSTRVPIGSVLSFPSPTGVKAFFGASSSEGTNADIYFAGFENSNIKPGAMLFAQYNQSAVAGYLRGGNVSAMAVADINALGTGSVIAAIDGYTRTAASVDLSGAASFSAAATLIQSGLNASPPQAATCSLGTISGTTMTVAGTFTGSFAVGQTVTGSGVTANSIITALGTGTGGLGTYILSQSSTIGVGQPMTASGTNVAVSYDSVSGAFVITSGFTGANSSAAFATGTLSTGLKLTSATGATLSQGAGATTPSVLMNAIINKTTNFASFMTLVDPDGGSGNTLKQAFANWNGLQNKRYVYAVSDGDITPTESTAATTSLGYLLKTNKTDGSIVIYDPDRTLAPFVCGMAASIDFTELQGRATFAFKSQSGMNPTVTDQTTGDNLIANGYNFYGSYATANDGFVFFYPGSISGAFEWADSYVDQIWLNNQFQLSLMVLLTSVKSIPYNTVGYSLIRAACMNVILQGLNFGAFQPGVVLSSSQAAEVNTAAGLPIDQTLFAQGWYLQVLPASPQTRANRQSPPMTFWYMDGGSVQQLNLASVEVQ